MENRIPVIMDCDPGHDDAIGLLLANASEKIDVLAVTTCGGNQTVEKTTYNAQRVCTLLDMNVPIGKGAARPLTEVPMNAPSVHGKSGLDGPALPEPAYPISDLPAIELMAQTIRSADRPVTIVSTGPMTNTAGFLLAHPELKPKVAQVSMMGGGIGHGNWTPAAEFNILADPEAADMVFRSGVPILMAGLDVTEQALIYRQDIDRIRALGNHVASVVADWIEFFFEFHRQRGYAGAPLHDPVATAALIAPELFQMRELYVQIETQGEFCRGATVGDVNGSTGNAPNARCIMGLDRQGFVDLLCSAVQTYGR